MSCSATSSTAGSRPRRRGGFVPAVDVYYVGNPPRAVVRADLAGIDPAQLELEIRGRELILAGQRLAPAADQERLYQQLEIEHGPFRRVVALGADVDADARASHLRGRHARRRAADRRARRPAPVPIEPGRRRERRRAGHDDRHRDLSATAPAAVEMGAPSMPDQLPVLPLRDTVTFPDTLTPLAVGQERSIQLVNDVLARDRQLVMVGSRTPRPSRPGPASSTASASSAPSRACSRSPTARCGSSCRAASG